MSRFTRLTRFFPRGAKITPTRWPGALRTAIVPAFVRRRGSALRRRLQQIGLGIGRLEPPGHDSCGPRSAETPAARRRFTETIATVDHLEAVIGTPIAPVRAKVVPALDGICRDFIARSPFIVVASSDASGRVDVSPKGDPPGFVQVLDDRTLAIPDRPGNRRADTFRNVLENPKVGLVFIVPGKGETLRVSGRARIVRDPWLRETMAIGPRVPALALIVEVEEAFFHCTKSMVRSNIWKPETWNPEGLASIGEAMVAHGQLRKSVKTMVAIAEHDVRTNLY